MLYLGVDLGGTNIKAALVNSEGEILCEAGIPTNLPRPAEAVCDDIATRACSWQKERTLQVLVSDVRELWTAEPCCIPTIWTGMILQWRNIWLKR